MKKKFLSIFLSMLIVFSSTPTSAMEIEDPLPSDPLDKNEITEGINKDVEPIINSDTETDKNKDAEPIINNDTKTGTNKDAEPIININSETDKNNDAEPIINNDSETDINKDAEPVINSDTKTDTNKDAKSAKDKQNRVKYDIALHFPSTSGVEEYDPDRSFEYDGEPYLLDHDKTNLIPSAGNTINLINVVTDSTNMAVDDNNISLWQRDNGKRIITEIIDSYAWFYYPGGRSKLKEDMNDFQNQTRIKLVSNGQQSGIKISGVPTVPGKIHYIHLYYEKINLTPPTDTITYTLTYDVNFPSGSLASLGTPADQIITTNEAKDQTMYINANLANIDNYKFLGWSKDKESTYANYFKGDEIEFNINEKIITLYAVWEKNEVINPPIHSDDITITREYNGSFQNINAENIIQAQKQIGNWQNELSMQVYRKKGVELNTSIYTKQKNAVEKLLIGTFYAKPYDSKKYEYSTFKVYLTITKKPVTITANSSSYTYDGAEKTLSGLTADGLVGAAKASTEHSITRTTIGTTDYILDDEDIIIENDIKDNYSFTFENGSLTIKAIAVSDNDISIENVSKVYDGTALTSDSLVVDTGDIISPTVVIEEKSITNVGSVDVVITVTSPSFVGSITKTVQLIITKKPVTITANSASYTYDGTEKTLSGLTADGLVGDAIASTELSVSRTIQGTTDYELEAKDVVIRSGEIDVTSNYDIKTINGTLTITLPIIRPVTPRVVPTIIPTPTIAVAIAPQPETRSEIVIAEITPQVVPTNTPEPTTDSEIYIADNDTPLVGGNSWSLVDLILTVITGLTSLALLITYYTKKKDDQDETEKVESEEQEDNLRRKGLLRISSLFPTLLIIWIFITTQDMRNPMVLFDKYTWIMTIITIVQLVIAYLSRKVEDEKELDKE